MRYRRQSVTEKPKETCYLGIADDIRSKDSLSKFMADENSYIHEHLATLFFLTRISKPNKIVEIGTGEGHSTLAFAQGCAVNGKGHVISIDIEEKGKAIDLLQDENLYTYVTFMKDPNVSLIGGIDILFIDGDHSYESVKKDIEKYYSEITEGGFIVFHDAYNPAHPGVMKAIQESINNVDRVLEWDYYEWFNCNGLVIIQRKLQDWPN